MEEKITNALIQAKKLIKGGYTTLDKNIKIDMTNQEAKDIVMESTGDNIVELFEMPQPDIAILIIEYLGGEIC
jgi:hypothetical protein